MGLVVVHVRTRVTLFDGHTTLKTVTVLLGINEGVLARELGLNELTWRRRMPRFNRLHFTVEHVIKSIITCISFTRSVYGLFHITVVYRYERVGL